MIEKTHGFADSHFLPAQSVGRIVPDAGISAVKIDGRKGDELICLLILPWSAPAILMHPPYKVGWLYFSLERAPTCTRMHKADVQAHRSLGIR